MYQVINSPKGTAWKSRVNDKDFNISGKTGTSQVKKITERDRELDLKTFEIPYEERDHALYIAFGPYKNPRYALSILVEHGGKIPENLIRNSFIEITDYATRREIDKMSKKLKPLGLTSTSRTGAIAMTRGAEIFK